MMVSLDETVYISTAGTMHRHRLCGGTAIELTLREGLGKYSPCMNCFNFEEIKEAADEL